MAKIQKVLYLEENFINKADDYCLRTGRVLSRLIEIAVKDYMDRNN